MLDDAAAAALAPGRVVTVTVVLRADNVWRYSDGDRWKVSLLEVLGISD